MALPLSTKGKCCGHLLASHSGNGLEGTCVVCSCVGFVPEDAVDMCSNCDHPVGHHGEKECQSRYLAEDPPCGCTWHEEADHHDPLIQCRAHAVNQATGMTVRCQIMVTRMTRHTSDHRNTDTCWTEQVAIYPAPADISAQVLAEKGTRHGQVGGDHYRRHAIQPWDVWDEYDLDRYTANAVKYLLRAGDKGPKIQDLKKAQHYLAKAIEREEQSGGT